MSSDEQAREKNNYVVDDGIPGVSQDPPDGRDKVPSSPVEAVIETVIEEEVKPLKATAEVKPKHQITKEPVEPIEPIKEEKPEPIAEENPKMTLKEMVTCPGCNLSMTQHSLKYIHKKRGYCKGIKKNP